MITELKGRRKKKEGKQEKGKIWKEELIRIQSKKTESKTGERPEYC